MIGGIEKLARQLGERAAHQAMMTYENWQYGIDSPIERILAVGLFALVESSDYLYAPVISVESVKGEVTDALHPMVRERIFRDGTMLVQMQHKLLDWRADFVISIPSVSDKKVIVECDGHDFHERTKEQAARDRSRDRAAQEAGHMMLRYTGSEIYRDPMMCAENVIKAISNLNKDKWLASVLGPSVPA